MNHPRLQMRQHLLASVIFAGVNAKQEIEQRQLRQILFFCGGLCQANARTDAHSVLLQKTCRDVAFSLPISFSLARAFCPLSVLARARSLIVSLSPDTCMNFHWSKCDCCVHMHTDIVNTMKSLMASLRRQRGATLIK
jgi:hypothetical protein